MFEPEALGHVLDLVPFASGQLPSLGDVSHPVQAYLNALAPSSRRPQLSALDWIARRSTQVFTAETMPWQRLRRPHVLKVRGLLEENYQPASRPGGSVRSAGSRSGSGRRLLTTCAEPGSEICWILASTWLRCRRWRGMPRPPPPPVTTVGIEESSAGLPSCSRCPTRSRRIDPKESRGCSPATWANRDLRADGPPAGRHGT